MTATATPRPTSHKGSGIRGWAGLALVILVGTVLLTLANLDRAGSTEPLHPENPGETGARAVARVLEQQGVEVEVVESDHALRDTALGEDTTLVVTSTEELGSTTYPGLRDALQHAGTTVLVAPTDPVLEALGVEATGASAIGGEVQAECDLPLLEGLTVEAVGTTYAVPGGSGSAVCFRSGPGAELPGLVATTGDTVLLGAPGVLANATVEQSDNAAVALRLLGQRERVVWYHASDDDLRAGDTRADADELAQVLPDWLGPSLLLLGAAVLVALLWQGRRFGPLVVEPLPVVVRSDETEASRGRLYRAARARQHAADALRADARSAWLQRLHLPTTTPLETLCEHLALRPGSPDRDTLRVLLEDGPVPDDRALLRLAADLTALTDPDAPPAPRPEEDRP